MNEGIRQMLSHASIATEDLERLLPFYDGVLAALGCSRLSEHPGAVGYGRRTPELWVQTPVEGDERGTGGHGVHIGLAADSRDQVDAFYQAALRRGGEASRPPEERPHYGQPVYAVFVRDPEGRVVEAAFRDTHTPAEGARAS